MIEKIKKVIGFRKNSNTPDSKIADLYNTLGNDVIRIKVGSDIVPFCEKLVNLISDMREELADETGFIMPLVYVTECLALQENEYVIMIKGAEKCRGFVIPNEKGVLEEIYENLKNTVLSNISTIMTNEMTEKYIEKVRQNNSLMVWDITGTISTTEIRIILTDLLENGKSIKNISGIFERISEQIYVKNTSNSRNPYKIATEIIKEI